MSLLDITFSNTRFIDWFFMAFAGLITWFLGRITTSYQYTIKPPNWLAKISFARTNLNHEVDLIGFAFQIMGLIMFLLSFVAWIAPSHQQAVRLYGLGLLIILLIVGLSVIYIRNLK